MAQIGRPYPFHFRRDLSLSYDMLWGMPKGWVWKDMVATGTHAADFNGQEFFCYPLNEKNFGGYLRWENKDLLDPGPVWVNIELTLSWGYPEYWYLVMSVIHHSPLAERFNHTLHLYQQLPLITIPSLTGVTGPGVVQFPTPGTLTPASYALF